MVEKITDDYFDPNIHYLGTQCKYGHEFKNTKKSRRYKSNGSCIICHARNYKKYKWKKFGSKIVSTKEKERRRKLAGIASMYCKKHYDCLNKVSKTKMKEMPCYKCERIKEVIKS